MPRRQGPPRVLCVAEKPSVAKGVSQIIGRGYNVRNGLSVYNKIYEYQCNMLGEMCHVKMTSVSGHVMEHAFPLAYKSWASVSPAVLFTANVDKRVKAEMENIEKTLIRESRQSDWLVLWTDCDREGENIACEIRDICLSANRGLRVLRAQFSAVTHGELIKACNTLRPVNQHESDAVDARSELDLRVGAAFTRMQTLCLQPRFADLHEKIISYGPCQFPTLGFVIDQYCKVEAFVSEAFWKIDMQYTAGAEDGNQIVKFLWARNRLFDKEQVEQYLLECRHARVAEVVKIEGKEKKRWTPLPLTTVEMCKLVSRKLFIDSNRCMQLAEKLYMEGYISYPRTETDQFLSSMDLPAIIQQQTEHPQWGQFARNLLAQDAPPIRPRQGTHNDQSHPPIHPTKDGRNLEGQEALIFELITRHFLAVCSQMALGFETTVTAAMGNEKFTCKGLVIHALNWYLVYPYEKWNAKTIPHFEEGQQFTPSFLDIVEGATEAPKMLSEAELITLMDENGIGTDATMPEHIANILRRQYALQGDDRLFYPSSLGMALEEAYARMGFQLTKPHLRAEMERALVDICQARKTKADICNEYSGKYKDIFVSAYTQTQLFIDAVSKFFETEPAPGPTAGDDNGLPTDTLVRTCQGCGSQMTLRKGKSDKYRITCMGYPTCKYTIWFGKVASNITVANQICNNCSSETHGEVKQIEVKFLAREMDPRLGPEYRGCVFCDYRLDEALQSETVGRPAGVPPPGTRRGGGPGSANSGAGRGRGASSVGSGRGGSGPPPGPGPGPGRGGGRGSSGVSRGSHVASANTHQNTSAHFNRNHYTNQQNNQNARNNQESHPSTTRGNGNGTEVGARIGTSNNVPGAWIEGKVGQSKLSLSKYAEGIGVAPNANANRGTETNTDEKSGSDAVKSGLGGARKPSRHAKLSLIHTDRKTEASDSSTPSTCAAVPLRQTNLDQWRNAAQSHRTTNSNTARDASTRTSTNMNARTNSSLSTSTDFKNKAANGTKRVVETINLLSSDDDDDDAALNELFDSIAPTNNPPVNNTAAVNTAANNPSAYKAPDFSDEDDLFNEALDGVEVSFTGHSNARMMPSYSEHVGPAYSSHENNAGASNSGHNYRTHTPNQEAAPAIPLCSCDRECIVRTTTREGPNTGRQFYCCAGPPDNKCDIFAWMDDITPDAPNCDCNIPSVRLKTKSEGRVFYTCLTKTCKFFECLDPSPDQGLQGGGSNRPGGGNAPDLQISNDRNMGRSPNITFNTYSTYNHQQPTTHTINYQSFNYQTNSSSSYTNSNTNTAGYGNHGNIQSNDSNPSCDCGEPSTQRTTQKPGPNLGRKFYVCAKPQATKCSYFLWSDTDGGGMNGNVGHGGGNYGSSSHTNNTSGNYSQNSNHSNRGALLQSTLDSHPRCDCGNPAAERTVSKEGANVGKKFFGCGKGEGARCDFFEWKVKENHSHNGSGSMYHSSHGGGQHTGNGMYGNTYANDNSNMQGNYNTAASSTAPECKCFVSTAERTVQKEGPNKGKRFWTCPFGPSRGCGFFEWVNPEAGAGMDGGSNGYGNNGGGASLVCFNCNQPGHWATNCPQKKGTSSWGGSTHKRKVDANDRSSSGKIKRCCSICKQPGHTMRTCARQ
ncbi:hypothetical protein SARC_05050 [Sphaeroforma arctica JP610]|uniref:DNA topoisomerase n=1 Tax=Sphaeroforma arctica JP610 TaxID=667725 RepID=A0A0L0G3B4_9EUKA|nr:hypothetical protein SARC_05050 [Sphaeroforma arctica JP610]KNC82673.1 hypothetical protein SARC_05050 [Sphaeroforma arctica JP610]|eukprot:XP_014156575.1 hypothetical protein SARC_05050 [Sphaeroforma arctica JP610]